MWREIKEEKIAIKTAISQPITFINLLAAPVATHKSAYKATYTVASKRKKTIHRRSVGLQAGGARVFN